MTLRQANRAYLRWLDSPASDVNDAAVRAEDAFRRSEFRRDHPKEQAT